MLHIHKDGERATGNQEGRGERGREKEGVIIFQVHSESGQDVHFNIHKLTAPAKDSYKNYLREHKIKLTV
jgi:hypothetical protein